MWKWFAIGAVATWFTFARRRGSLPTRPRSDVCEYEAGQWSSRNDRIENRQHVRKPFAQVTRDETSPVDSRCTVCESDQVEIRPSELGSNADAFRVCWAHAPRVRRALQRAVRAGARIEDVVGYRPGKTRGPTDSAGRRTVWSNHSFGTAVDINDEYNGLYSCERDPEDPRLPSCRRLHGGAYDPADHPRESVTRQSPIYRELRESGWRWGGDVVPEVGYADLMHFSLDGT